MNALQGTIKNGQIVLDVPAELPEGSRVEVLPIEAARPTLGIARKIGRRRRKALPRCWRGWIRSSRGGSHRKTMRRGGRHCASKRTSRRPASLRTPMRWGECGNDSIPARHRHCRGLPQPPPRRIYTGPGGGRSWSPGRLASRFSPSCGTGSRTAAAGIGMPSGSPVLPDMIVWPLTEQAAEVYGRIPRS